MFTRTTRRVVLIAAGATQQGTYIFTVNGTDQHGQALHQTYSITVN
jgi:hypothetical protein